MSTCFETPNLGPCHPCASHGISPLPGPDAQQCHSPWGAGPSGRSPSSHVAGRSGDDRHQLGETSWKQRRLRRAFGARDFRSFGWSFWAGWSGRCSFRLGGHQTAGLSSRCLFRLGEQQTTASGLLLLLLLLFLLIILLRIHFGHFDNSIGCATQEPKCGPGSWFAVLCLGNSFASRFEGVAARLLSR